VSDGEDSLPFEADDEDSLPFETDDEGYRREEARWWIARMRSRLADARDHRSRQPCPDCGITDAVIISTSGQNTVRCQRCGKHLYNAPKTETGEQPRTVRTLRADLKPSQQARILDRDSRRCVLCGTADGLMVIGHLLSVEDGVSLGATELELSDDANLATMCEACNLGLGGRSILPRTYAVIMLHLVRADLRRTTPASAGVQAAAEAVGVAAGRSRIARP